MAACRSGKAYATQGSGGPEVNLELMAGFLGRADDIHLEPRLPRIVDIDAHHQQLPVGHFHPELAPIGAHDRLGNLVAAQDAEGIGDAAEVLQRHRSQGGTSHLRCSARRAVSVSSDNRSACANSAAFEADDIG